ncbi:LptE family protein [Porphyromonas sp.]|uniref:LptE family protein n=1 Tax=Porphyromonas sp. TaxID=1924944 RepID=UPI003AB349AB
MVRSKLLYIIGVVMLLLMGTSCSISYKFNGATIDYTRIKTVTIEDFPNQAPLVYPPLSQMFSERLREQFRRNTRLEPVETNGDLILEGAIVGYELTPMAMQEDALSAMTRFTITVRVSYTNMVEEKKSFSGRTFTSSQEFDSNNLFSDIQEGLAGELIDDLVKQIFNATVEDW